MHNATIVLHALPEQCDLIERAASLLGKSRSDFMLEAACKRAQAVLLDRTIFRADAEKLQQFVAFLDAPCSHSPGLERLMGIKPPWNTNIE